MPTIKNNTIGDDLVVEPEDTVKVNSGILYENKIKGIVKATARHIKQFSLSTLSSGGNDNEAADIYINVNRQRYGIEVKLDARAPLGTPAKINFDQMSGQFQINSTGKNGFDIDPSANKAILSGLKTRTSQCKDFINFVKNSAPREYHANVAGFPVMCIVDSWNDAKDKGLLKAINTTVKYDISIVADYYKSKGIDYMQIGGAGLFYLKDNPLNLPLPKLSGEVNIEIRLKSRGEKQRAGLGVTVVTGVLVAVPRMATRNKSPYSLDDKTSILELFGEKS